MELVINQRTIKKGLACCCNVDVDTAIPLFEPILFGDVTSADVALRNLPVNAAESLATRITVHTQLYYAGKISCGRFLKTVVRPYIRLAKVLSQQQAKPTDLPPNVLELINSQQRLRNDFLKTWKATIYWALGGEVAVACEGCTLTALAQCPDLRLQKRSKLVSALVKENFIQVWRWLEIWICLNLM